MPDVLMPRLSDTMTEGVISQWLKREGDQVRRGEILAEIETDKAIMELEAYDSGVLTRIIAEAGSTVPVGEPIAIIGVPSPAAPPPQSAAPPPAPVAAPRVRATPLVRALAREHDIDLAGVTGTGPGGRIVRADIAAMIEPNVTTPAPLDAPGDVPAQAPGRDDDERVPLSAIRRVTARRLSESAAVPHFYLTTVVDVGALQRLRAELNAALGAEPFGAVVKISVTDMLIRACAVAVSAHPVINSSWGGDHLLRHRRVNIGCAVAVDDGLVVPVIVDANRKSLTEIAAATHALTGRARAGKLTAADLSGGTFTISNLGMYGIDHFTAIINPPEAAILAVGAVQQEAVVRDGQLTVATTLKLTLAIDHRVLDGAAAAAFLRDLGELLQHPVRILV